MNITVNVEIKSSKSKVWTAITDIDNCIDMISGIIDLKVIHKPEKGLIGLKWTETRKMFGKEVTETMWITDCKTNEFYCTRAENCGAIYSTKIMVTETDNKTQLTMNFSDSSDSFFVRMMSAIMSLFIKKSMIKMLEKDLSEIKAFVEKS